MSLPNDYLDEMFLEYHNLDENGLPKHEEWEHAAHYEHEEKLLWARNICVIATVVLFILSFLPIVGQSGPVLKAIAYFCGAGAYVSEIAVLTDGFHRRENLREMLMPYLFAPLYVFLGVTYLLH